MILPTGDQLDQISHADLVALVKALISRVERLEEENRQLKTEIERLKQPPANSGILHNRLLAIKEQSTGRQAKEEARASFGHKRAIREVIDNPNRTISVEVDQCERCHHDLKASRRKKSFAGKSPSCLNSSRQ